MPNRDYRDVTAASDEELVSCARTGDRSAFAELVERHQRMLLRLCERSLGDRDLAEDVVQEAVLQALLGLDALKRPAQFGPWLAGIGLNLSRRWLRARPGDSLSLEGLLGGQQLDLPADALGTPDPAWVAEERELASRVRKAVDILPPGQRKAVVLFHLLGMTHVEVAAALGIQVGAVKTRLHKGREHLRRDLWTLWGEMQPMTTSATTPGYVDMQVFDIRRIVPKEQVSVARNVVLLQETGDQPRILGIWMGQFEAEMILILLSDVQIPRPLTFTFAISLLEAAGGQLCEVRVNKLVEKTFFAETVITGPDGRERIVDSRPRYAIALALTRGVPIRVAEEVMREAAHASSAAANTDMPVDGTHVLGKADISKEMEDRRIQRDAEMERAAAEFEKRRASGQTSG